MILQMKQNTNFWKIRPHTFNDPVMTNLGLVRINNSCERVPTVINALLQIMGFSWVLTTPTGLAMALINCLASDPLLCPFYKQLIICEKMALFFVFVFVLFFAKQIIHDLVLSCIVIEEFNTFIHVEDFLNEIWKLVNIVSYLSQQRGSPWIDAFEILHNNSC